MYRLIIRPLLFLLPPETIHKLIVFILRYFCKIPGANFLLKRTFALNSKSATIDFAGLKLNSYIGLAAGFDKNAEIYNEFSNFGFGFIEIGTVTPRPQPGNQKPRSFRLIKDHALINRMGFNNVGVDKVIENLKNVRTNNLIIGGNIGKNTDTPNSKAADDYEICFNKLYDFVDYFVVNVSCPNISSLSELQDPEALETILSRLIETRGKMPLKKPVFLKISPDLSFNQIDKIIDIYHKTKIDGIVATNTTISRENLMTDTELVRLTGSGGLSGKPLTQRSTEIIKYISENSDKKIPIIGVGGIMSAKDALDKIEAGASLVQVYTGFIYEGPFLIKRIGKAIQQRFHS